MFAGGKLSTRTFGGPFRPAVPVLGAAMRSYRLGDSDFEWYQKAKRAIAKYDELLRRVEGIGNITARRAIYDWLGSPNNPTTPAYRYRSVVSDVAVDVEGYTPPNYGAYALERRRGRVEDLEDVVEDFEAKVRASEREYGPVTVREVPGQVSPQAPGPDLTWPIVGAGVAVGLGLLFVLT